MTLTDERIQKIKLLINALVTQSWSKEDIDVFNDIELAITELLDSRKRIKELDTFVEKIESVYLPQIKELEQRTKEYEGFVKQCAEDNCPFTINHCPLKNSAILLQKITALQSNGGGK